MGSTQTAEVLFLSQADAIEAGVTDMERCIERMEYVFELYANDRVLMGGPGQYLHGHMTTFPSGLAEVETRKLRPGSRFGAMPAYVGGDVDKVGVKWYGSVTAKPNEVHPPRSPPLLVLTDPDTGGPLAIMDGSLISTMRTGAMAGLGAQYLQGHHAETATIIGPGKVGQASALALDRTLDSLEDVHVYHPELHKAEAFEKRMDETLAANVTSSDSAEASVSESDVIIAAASGDPSPRIESQWLKADSTVIQFGDLRVPLAAFDDGQIFCDIRQHPVEFETQVGWDITSAFNAAIDGTDGFSLEISDIRTLHELIGGTDLDETKGASFLSSLGLPMEDITWGNEVYENAISEGIGTTLTVHDEPYFSKPY